MKRNKTAQTLSGSMFIALVFSTAGCLLAVPVAIQYYQSTREYVATAEVAVNAEAVYRAAVKEAGARSSTIRIVKQEDPGRLLEITDGVQTASIKAVPLASEKTELVVVADVPQSAGGRESEQELALRIIRIVADSLGVRYEVTKK
ncbi:MAG: hypothetical protein ACM3SP_21765 [Chloroflexota bacterium]